MKQLWFKFKITITKGCGVGTTGQFMRVLCLFRIVWVCFNSDILNKSSFSLSLLLLTHYIVHCKLLLYCVMLCYAMLCCLLLFWFHFWHNRLFFSQAKYKIIIMFKSNNINKEFCNKRKEFRRTEDRITKHRTKHDKTLWYNL